MSQFTVIHEDRYFFVQEEPAYDDQIAITTYSTAHAAFSRCEREAKALAKAGGGMAVYTTHPRGPRGAWKVNDIQPIDELTDEDMRAAHFSRQCDQDINYDSGPDCAYYATLERMDGQDEYRARAEAFHALARYYRGKLVLDAYTMSYSQRTTVPIMADGSADPTANLDAYDNYIIVDAGFIATSAARTFARFRRRA